MFTNHTSTTTTTGTRRRRRSVRVGVMAAAAVAPIGLAACGSDEDDSAEPAAEAGPVEIGAIDYAYTDVPESVAAGTQLALRNDSDVEVHELVAVKLPEDEERSIDELVQLPPEELEATLLPNVTTVIIAPPEGEGMAVVGDGALSEPGRYALICVIPTGADPDEYLAAAAESEGPPDVAGGPPHIVEGMFAEVIVTG